MERLNKLMVFDMCVDGSRDGAKERFKDLIGPMFKEFNSFYSALRNASVCPSDIDVITYKQLGQNVTFSIHATNDPTDHGIIIHIPITKGA